MLSKYKLAQSSKTLGRSYFSKTLAPWDHEGVKPFLTCHRGMSKATNVGMCQVSLQDEHSLLAGD